MITTRRRKLNIIIASISVVLLIIIGICVYLYFTTDMFKSNKMLFGKYIQKMAQNVETIVKDPTGEAYNNLLQNNKYTSTTEVSATYINGKGTTAENNQNVINSLKVLINGKTDKLNGVDYKDFILQKQENKVAEVEYLKSNGQYGLRFTDLFGKYIAVQNNNLKEIAEKMEIDANVPDEISDIDIEKELKFTDIELNTENEDYANILLSLAENARFSKEKNVGNIEVGNNAYTANEYTLTLSKEELNDGYIKLLEKMKEDQILLHRVGLIDEILNPQIENVTENEMPDESVETSSPEATPSESPTASLEPSASPAEDEETTNNIQTDTPEEQSSEEQTSEETEKQEETYIDKYKSKIDSLITQIRNTNIGNDETTITVYESKGTALKAEIRTPEYIISLEAMLNGENDSYIKLYKEINGIDQNTDEIVLEKKENKTYLNREQRKDDSIKRTNITNDREIINGTKESKTTFEYDTEKNYLKLEFTGKSDIVNDFDKIDEFTDSNSVVLNGLTDEEFQQVKDQLNDKGIEKLNAVSNDINIDEIFGILSQLGIVNEKVTINNMIVLTTSEVSRFNAQFEIYKDQQIKVDGVEKLLELVKNNLDNIEVVSDSVIKLNIVKDTANEQLAEKVKEIINSEQNKNKEYLVMCEYDEETNILKAINLQMIEKK